MHHAMHHLTHHATRHATHHAMHHLTHRTMHRTHLVVQVSALWLLLLGGSTGQLLPGLYERVEASYTV